MKRKIKDVLLVDMPSQLHVNDQIAAADVLMTVSSVVSSNLLTFTGWLIVGFGSALGVLIANVSNVEEYIDKKVLSSTVILYCVAFFFHMIQRYLETIVNSSHQAAEFQRSRREEKKPSIVNMGGFLEAIADASFPPVNYFMKWSFALLLNDNYMGPARLNAKLSQIQTLLMVLQGILFISILWELGKGLNS